jgi:eukaryotic-like serine/threonine-protein kinase
MPLSAGTRLGSYEVVCLIGVGGMGEVYRARDIKLSRDVALKVLPSVFASDPERMARFEREARLLASLNHSNIATIYGLEDSAIVMELVEGPTLAERIAAGPMPLDEAIPVALQIVEALDYAHDRGVIHRDLKPANVKITPDGKVKLLDFGLAKALGDEPESAPSQDSPTLTMGATRAGVILGTAAYMSPEQVNGKRADRRSDVWAFGVVLCEMLTGKRLFAGETTAEILSSVMKDQPSLEGVPATMRPLLARCLEKNPRQRLQAIGEVRIALEKPVAPASAGEAPATAPSQSRLGWVAAAAAVLALAVLAFLHFREQPPERQVLRYTLAPPEKTSILQFAVSPDGHYVVMSTSEGSLSVRALDSLQTQSLAGTRGATYPFWSADSRYIGFFADGKLKKISVNGGPAQALCDVPVVARGGTWNREGVILFATKDGLSRVPAAGGAPVAVTKLEGLSLRNPVFLPDGRRFLYVALQGKDNGIYSGSLDSKESRRIVPDQSQPAYFDDHLLFVRDQTLMAQPVDPKTMNSKGDLFPVAEQVSSTTAAGERLYSISENGVLIYQTGGIGGETQHLWFDRAGKELGAVGGPVRSAENFALSPDGKRVVIERLAGSGSDLWISDLEHSTESRFTFDAGRNVFPVWSPDGNKVAFASNRGGVFNLYQRTSNGTGRDERLLESKEENLPWDWSRDGRFLIFGSKRPKGYDLWALPLAGDRKPVPLVLSEFLIAEGQLSPDGRWLAYTSNESGKLEVYVVPFGAGSAKPAAGKWQISTAGGAHARWRGDGKELFYVAPARKLMAVEVKASTPTFERGTPQALFESRSNVPAANSFLWGYVPSADGKRFLIVTTAGQDGEPPPLTVVVNWLAAVKK